MPDLQYRNLGFKSFDAYDDFCRYIVQTYEENTNSSAYSIRDDINNNPDFFEQEFGHAPEDITERQVWWILKKYDADIRSENRGMFGGNPKRRKNKQLVMTIRPDAYNYIMDVSDMFEGYHMRRELYRFMIAIVRGTPSKHMIFWLAEYKPVLVLHNSKTGRYTMISEDLSKIEAQYLGEVMTHVEHERSLDPLVAYCNEQGLQYWGHNE